MTQNSRGAKKGTADQTGPRLASWEACRAAGAVFGGGALFGVGGLGGWVLKVTGLDWWAGGDVQRPGAVPVPVPGPASCGSLWWQREKKK